MCSDINKSDIKLMQSLRLDDTEQGGGQMTSKEVIDGQVNNLFPDISRLDRVYGRVSMRKAYLAVQTGARETYYGSHTIITEQTSDPNVSVCFFSSQDWFDYRESAKDRIEAYLVKGPAYPSAVWGDHYSGTKLLSLVVESDWDEPLIGDVLVVEVDKNLSGTNITTKTQFLRITEKSSELKTFMKVDGTTFVKKELKITFGQSLLFDIPGDIITTTNTQGLKTIFTSVAADTSLYYGVSDLETNALTGDLTIKVDSIMAPLVPSANSQTAITDFGPGMTRPIMLGPDNTDDEVTLLGILNFTKDSTTILGVGIKPGTFEFGTYVKDDGGFNILDMSTLETIGEISYGNGEITMYDSAYDGEITEYFKFQPATEYAAPAKSGSIIVEENNRGFVYVFNCNPSPKTHSVRIDYMASGKWYSLYDNGLGQLAGSDSAIGSGTVNYITGSISITLGAMPDVGSMIMFYWGVTMGTYDIHSYNTGYVPYTDFQLDEEAELGTLIITWTLDDPIAGPIPMEVYDIGDGTLNLKKNGVVFLDVDDALPMIVGNYDKIWKKATLQHMGYTPKTSQEYNISYLETSQDISREQESITGSGTGDRTHVLTITEAITPGSVKIKLAVSMQDPAVGDSYTTTKQDGGSWSKTQRRSSQSSTIENIGHPWSRSVGSRNTGYQRIYGVNMVGVNFNRSAASAYDRSGTSNSLASSASSLEIVGSSVGTIDVYDLGTGLLYYNGSVVGNINYTNGAFTIDENYFIATMVKEVDTSNSSSASASSDSSSSSSGVAIDDGNSSNYGTSHWTNTWNIDGDVASASGRTYSSNGAISRNTNDVLSAQLLFKCSPSDAITISWTPISSSGVAHTQVVTHPLEILFPIAPGYNIVAGSFWLNDIDGTVFVDDAMGKIRIPTMNELSEDIASINYSTGVMTMNKNLETQDAGLAFGIINGLATRYLDESSYWSFRCPGSPITPGSFTLQTTTIGGEVLTATAGFDGQITGDKVDGYIRFDNGVVEVMFGEFLPWIGNETEVWAQDAPQVDNGGVISVFKHEVVQSLTMTMNCVVESSLPLNADLLGLNPVRLPMDGKVPIFRDGYIIVIHNSENTDLPYPLTAGDYSCGRTSVDLLEMYKMPTNRQISDGTQTVPILIQEVGNYSVDLSAGTITVLSGFVNPVDTDGLHNNLIIMSRIEDMCLASDVQITGHITVTSPLTHDYVAADTLVSSVLPSGDMQSRAYGEFEQTAWLSEWTDEQVGVDPLASYNFVDYPITVSNTPSIKERWLFLFSTSTRISIIGENFGVLAENVDIGTGNAVIGGKNCIAVENKQFPGEYYFVVQCDGFGVGWASGNCIRFNQDAANFPLWFIRTTLQAPPTEPIDHYTIQIRGDSS